MKICKKRLRIGLDLRFRGREMAPEPQLIVGSWDGLHLVFRRILLHSADHWLLVRRGTKRSFRHSEEPDEGRNQYACKEM